VFEFEAVIEPQAGVEMAQILEQIKEVIAPFTVLPQGPELPNGGPALVHDERLDAFEAVIGAALDVGLLFWRRGPVSRQQFSGVPVAWPGQKPKPPQIIKQADFLKKVSIEAIYASPLRRTRQSAAIISERNNLDVEFSDKLMEIDLGNLEGTTFKDSMGTYERVLKEWQDRNFNSGFPGGETFNDVKSRLNEFLDEIEKREAINILVIGHGLLFLVVLWYYCKNEKTPIYDYAMGRGHLSIIKGKERSYILDRFNISP